MRSPRANRAGVGAALLTLALAGLGTHPASAGAQAPRVAGESVSSRPDDMWSAPGPLVRGRDLATLGAFALTSAALMPFDERISHWARRPTFQQNAGLRRTATVFRVLGSPGALGLAVATYGVGLVAHDRPTADVGLHATGALAVGSALTALVKGSLGRARPYVVHDSASRDYAFGRGFRKGDDYSSLPSGHATAAFAFATVLSREVAHWRPDAGRVVTPAAYGAATLVALSRIYNDKHWASDVALGAGIGTFSGLTVVRHQHGHPDNAVDRRLLPRGGTSSAAGTAPTPVRSGRSGTASHFRIGRRAVIGTPIAEYVPERLVSGRLALVGDAAHVPTPMTGSGFAASIEDAETLGGALRIGGASVVDALLAYERRRLDAVRQLVRSGQQYSRGFSRGAA